MGPKVSTDPWSYDVLMSCRIARKRLDYLSLAWYQTTVNDVVFVLYDPQYRRE